MTPQAIISASMWAPGLPRQLPPAFLIGVGREALIAVFIAGPALIAALILIAGASRRGWAWAGVSSLGLFLFLTWVAPEIISS